MFPLQSGFGPGPLTHWRHSYPCLDATLLFNKQTQGDEDPIALLLTPLASFPTDFLVEVDIQALPRTNVGSLQSINMCMLLAIPYHPFIHIFSSNH